MIKITVLLLLHSAIVTSLFKIPFKKSNIFIPSQISKEYVLNDTDTIFHIIKAPEY